MRALLSKFSRMSIDTEGQDLIEYGLLVGLISLVAVLAVGAVGSTLNTLFWQTISSGLAGAV
jgi:Flp pilus assembly pilin Flp